MVAFKMGRRQGGPSRTGTKGAYLNRYVTDPAAAGQPPAHFQRNPPGGAQLAVFPSGGRRTRSLRIKLDMLVARAWKNSQLTCGHMPATYETMHYTLITFLAFAPFSS
jgi:hypothetical protein